MEGSVDAGNSTVNGTSDGSNDAGNKSLESIMGGMAESNAPDAKPDSNRENEEGSNTEAKVTLPAWTSQLSDELKNDKSIMDQISKFEKISELAKGYSELEKKLGKSIVKPGKDASTEELENYYQQLGKPKSVDKYSLDDKDAQFFKEIAYKNNLTDEQCTSLYAAFKEVGNAAIKQQQNNMAQKFAETETLLKNEWGNKFDEKITMLQRGVNAYGGAELGNKLKNSGLLADPTIVKMFVLLGEQNAEAGTTTKGASGEKDYIPTSEGGKFSFIK